MIQRNQIAMECEWNSWQEVKDDFEKLLWSRAELHDLREQG